MKASLFMHTLDFFRLVQKMGAHILVVEDDPGIQELIAVNLSHAGYSVDLVAQAEAAYLRMREALPDLILVDWMLPGISGIELTRQLRTDPNTRDLAIIMLTARHDERDKITGFEVGADDYVTKPFSPRVLLARMGAVLRRRVPQETQHLLEVRGLRLDPAAQRVSCADVNLALGPTEFRLLHYLMTHPNRVYSREQLLNQVWGGNYMGEERTVDVHIRRLRAALEQGGHDVLIQTVRGCGYRFSVSTD